MKLFINISEGRVIVIAAASLESAQITANEAIPEAANKTYEIKPGSVGGILLDLDTNTL